MHEEIGSRPVTAVVAAAGYGKTTAVRTWLEGNLVHWCSGSVPPSTSGSAAGDDQFIVLDRPAALADEPPRGVRLVLVSRTPLDGPVSQWRSRGMVTDIGPTDLTIDATRVAEVLTRHGVTEPSLATALHDLTGGWPALVRMGAEALSQTKVDPAELARALTAPGTDIHRFITTEVCGDLPPTTRQLAVDLAQLEWATEELVLALNQRDQRRRLRQLITMGLTQPAAGGAARHRIVPLVASVLRGTHRLPARRRVLTVAAHWYAGQQEPAEAIRAALAADDPSTCAALLAQHGQELLDQGQPTAICSAARALPPDAYGDEVRLLYAEALFVTGNIDESLVVYQLLDHGGLLAAALAWRYGIARYLNGETEAGLEVLSRSAPSADQDGALLLAWQAAVYWKLGDTNACGEHAARAYDLARATDHGKALATSHIALALHAQLIGDRPAIQAHYERALTIAESVGDWFSVVRMRSNRAAGLLHEARYADALRMIEPAVVLAESAGYQALLALVLCNQGEALARLGRIDDAVAAYERATTLGMRTKKVAHALTGLGEVYRQCGRTSQARAAYEEAIRDLSDGGEWQVRVRALAGLARVVAETDPEQARALAERAVAEAPGPLLATALVSAGWAAAMATLDSGSATTNWAQARRLAEAAAEAARRHRDRAALAEALELSAYAMDDPSRARQPLTEALGIWCEAGADLDADRVRLAWSGTVEARLAADRLATAGVVPASVGWPPRGASTGDTVKPDRPAQPEPVRLDTLGRFAVVVGDEPVPLAAWRSRKARDLLRVLVSRRGRAIARDELSELLWPGEPADRVAHRLSVALSTVRAVLDPRRMADITYFIAGDTASLALNIDRLAIDAETFAEYARYGLDSLRTGRLRDARAALEAADRAYTGDFLDDEPYDDHAATVREQLRATFLQVTRALAGLARSAGEPDDAVRCLLRLLAADPYDEQAHRDLIEVLSECGRHGEAQRARTRYSRAMREIHRPAAG